jgi:hypothetical protein
MTNADFGVLLTLLNHINQKFPQVGHKKFGLISSNEFTLNKHFSWTITRLDRLQRMRDGQLPP